MVSRSEEEPMHSDNLKLNFAADLTPFITQKIGGRKLNQRELNALSFVIDKKYVAGESPDTFTKRNFQLTPEDNPQNASWKIYGGVHAACTEELDNRISEANESEGKGKYEAMKSFWDTIYKATAMAYKAGENFSLGSIPPDWIPAWFEKAKLTGES